MRRLGTTVAAVAAVAACVIVPASAGAITGPTKTVTIKDSYYSPAKLSVRPGTTVKWVWPMTLTQTHDVMLAKGPKGVKHFMSEYAAGGYSFKRKLTTPGSYTFICDLHQGMKMNVVVKR